MDTGHIVALGLTVFGLIIYLEFFRGRRDRKRCRPSESETLAATLVLEAESIPPGATFRGEREVIVEARDEGGVVFNCDLWVLVRLKLEDLERQKLDRGCDPMCVSITIGGRRPSARPQTFIAAPPDLYHYSARQQGGYRA